MLLMHKITNKRELGQYPSVEAAYEDTSNNSIDLTYEAPGTTIQQEAALVAPYVTGAKSPTVVPITGSIFKYLILFGGIGLGFYFVFRNK